MTMSSLSPTRNITNIVCGPDCTFVILENGQLFACGGNSFNRLGIGKDLKMASILVNVEIIFSCDCIKDFFFFLSTDTCYWFPKTCDGY